jgi:tripartite-type tricarboxylate transporter receptor subunit TctC
MRISIKTKWLLLALVTASLALLAPISAPRAAAESWPNRPVRLIVTLGPGSGVDIGARLFADKLSARWGQSVVVENRPGGDGMLAITSVLGAHDDHVLLVTPVGSFTAHPYFHDQLPYDPRDLVPIARITRTVIVVSVPTSLNVNSLKELEALARTKPGQLNWTTATGVTDFVFAGFLHTAGLSMAKVPYKNPVAAVSDLAEGRIQAYMPAYAIVRPQVLAGKVKVLAVSNHERAPALPDIPTATEAGYPSLEFDGLVGLFGTRELAADVRARIADDIRTVADDPVIVERLTASGQIVSPGNGTEFSASIEQQKAQVAAIAKLFGNKPVQ